MAARLIAPDTDSRNITSRERLALRAIRAGTMRATLVQEYVWSEGGKVYTGAVMRLAERGLVRFGEGGEVLANDGRANGRAGPPRP